jgi:hypothetical protein
MSIADPATHTDHEIGAEAVIVRQRAEIERLRLFLGEIAAMGPADEEWDANTLEHAVELAKRALSAAIGTGE